MSDRPFIPGAEPWSSPGEGSAARIGVLVVHGFTGNPASTRPLGQALAKRGFAVEVPCLPGHGTHWRDMARTGYADWRRAVSRAVDDLRSRCDKVVLGGLSMGGTLAVDVATERGPELAGVFAINAAILDREGLLAKLAPVISKIITAAPAKSAGLVKNDIAKPGGDELAYPWVPAKAGYSLVRELPRIRAHLAALTQPLLVAYSPQDHSVPVANSHELLRLAGSKDVTPIVLARSYHLATLDYDAELLEKSIGDFIARVTGVSAAA